jgi:pimeloyl-ACP methyl ester carboxylesterase
VNVIKILLIFACSILSAAPEDHWTTLDRNRIHYQVSGRGTKAIVFVHGWTCDASFWSRQVPVFDARYRVIALDLPGHGQSDAPREPYTIDLFSNAVDAVIKDAGVDSVVLIGHSMGAPILRQYVADHPSGVTGLVLVDGAVYSNEGEAGISMRKERTAGFLASLRGPSYRTNASMFIDTMFVEQTKPELREEIRVKMLSTPAHVAFSAMQNMTETRVWLDKPLSLPVLAITAVKEKSPTNRTERIHASHFSNLEYHEWNDVGHFLMMEQPERFNAAVFGFLDKIHF